LTDNRCILVRISLLGECRRDAKHVWQRCYCAASRSRQRSTSASVSDWLLR
jgi:hypothetical protein